MPLLSRSTRADLVSGFLVFLIALPLSLGIAMASGFPPVAGILTAVVGGVLATFVGSARLTIKGPAAGLIVIALGAVQELGEGDLQLGYRRALAVGVVAALLQIAFALARVASAGAMMPTSVVHGMLAAIGVIIVSKQIHLVLGVVPEASGPFALLLEVPQSVLRANPEVLSIGVMGLLVLFVVPRLPWAAVRKVPAPLVVLLFAVPMGLSFDFDHPHGYWFAAHEYIVGPNFLVPVPEHLLEALTLPDFSAIASGTSVKFIVMYALVGSIESVLSVAAVDALDPAKRASDPNRDLLSVGVGNLVASSIGGLPMISEIVRSKANIDNGAQTNRANLFHGLFLFAAVVLLPTLIHEIPMAALAAMLVFTGLRLASFQEFVHVFRIGRDQFVVFLVTLLATLATDLLLGVIVGLVVKLAQHLARGLPLAHLWVLPFTEERQGDVLRIEAAGAAVFTNFFRLMQRLRQIEPDLRHVQLDFSRCAIVDHTVLARVHAIADEWPACELEVVGLERHSRASAFPTATRWQPRGQAMSPEPEGD